MATPTETQKLQGEINKYTQMNSNPLALNLTSMSFNSLQDIVFKDNITEITIGGKNNRITTLENVRFPPMLRILRIHDSLLNSLRNVSFPNSLEDLSVIRSQLTTLEGVIFPPNLNILMLNGNRITSLKGVVFPNRLYQLYLDDNQITSFEGIKFPLSLSGLTIKDNPIDTRTVNLLERPTEVVRRSIIRDYPETAQYFEARRKIKDVTMQTLQNHVRSIAQFLQPLIDERKEKEEEKNRGQCQVLFVNMPNGVQYTIPFIPALPIQSAIDYLEQNYLLSVINGWDNIEIIYSGAPLNPERQFADYNIESEATLNVIARKLSQHGGRKKTKYNRLKIKKCKSCKHK